MTERTKKRRRNLKAKGLSAADLAPGFRVSSAERAGERLAMLADGG